MGFAKDLHGQGVRCWMVNVKISLENTPLPSVLFAVLIFIDLAESHCSRLEVYTKMCAIHGF